MPDDVMKKIATYNIEQTLAYFEFEDIYGYVEKNPAQPLDPKKSIQYKPAKEEVFKVFSLEAEAQNPNSRLLRVNSLEDLLDFPVDDETLVILDLDGVVFKQDTGDLLDENAPKIISALRAKKPGMIIACTARLEKDRKKTTESLGKVGIIFDDLLITNSSSKSLPIGTFLSKNKRLKKVIFIDDQLNNPTDVYYRHPDDLTDLDCLWYKPGEIDSLKEAIQGFQTGQLLASGVLD